MEWIYGLSHIVERRSSEENPNDSAQAGGSKKPQEKSGAFKRYLTMVKYQ